MQCYILLVDKNNTDENHRDRRRLKRAAQFGPLKRLVREVIRGDGCLEELACGHVGPIGPPRQTQTPGVVMRHCTMCKKEESEREEDSVLVSA